jgi:hypothetical protein
VRDVCVRSLSLPPALAFASFQYSLREAKLLYTISLRIDAALNRALPVIRRNGEPRQLDVDAKHVPFQPLTLCISM